MTDHELLKQLKSLKHMNPEASWSKSNREILLSQIANSGAKELSIWQRLFIDTRSFMSTVSHPAMALGSLLLLLIGTSAFAHLAFNRIKPNESLYIARIISEKAKLSTVFDVQEKEKLEGQFAAGHAEAITEVLADKNTDASNADQVALLNENFNKEIDTVRTKIALIKKNNPVAVVAPVLTASNTDEEILLTAGNGKDDQGLQLALPVVNAETATKTEEVKTEVKAIEVKEPEKVLDEAKALFDNKEYDSALNKLKEVKELIK